MSQPRMSQPRILISRREPIILRSPLRGVIKLATRERRPVVIQTAGLRGPTGPQGERGPEGAPDPGDLAGWYQLQKEM